MKIAVLAVATVLAGCVAYVPAEVVLFSNPDTIKIQWDEFRTNENEVRKKVEAHCSGRGVELIDAGQSPAGQFKWKTWRCAGPV